jgi:hypothetical protein
MNYLIKTSFCLVFFATSILILSACKKNEKPSTDPGITDVYPLSGPYNTTVTINGNNFSADPGQDIVKFNNKIAVVQSAQVNQLVVKVPASAGSGPISITINGKTITGPVFSYWTSTIVSTYAGNGIGDPSNGASNISDLNSPVAVAFDRQGNLFVAEYNRIKKITPAGVLSVFAGSGLSGYFDTSVALQARFNHPIGLAVDQQGNVYVADRDNSVIRKITPTGAVSTLAGNYNYGYADGTGTNAKFWTPVALTIDNSGNLYVADQSNNRIRKITPAGVVTTIAGDGNYGYVDGPANVAEFRQIKDLAVDKLGNIYVAEEINNRIRKITSAGVVTTFAGSGAVNHKDGVGTNADFSRPYGITVDSLGIIYVADNSTSVIRKITSAAVVTTLAGLPSQHGYVDGSPSVAKFYAPEKLAIDALGNVYVADRGNNRIRKISVQ